MTHSRRNFLMMIGIAGGALALIGPIQCLDAATDTNRLLGLPLTADEFEALAGVAFKHARALGCSYTGVRITCARTGAVLPRTRLDRMTGKATRVLAVMENVRVAFEVRVAHSGACGRAQIGTIRAASLGERKDEISNLTKLAIADAQGNANFPRRPASLIPAPASSERWAAPRRKHPLDMTARAERAFRQALNDAAARLKGAVNAGSGLTVYDEETYFVSTGGAHQHGHRLSVV